MSSSRIIKSLAEARVAEHFFLEDFGGEEEPTADYPVDETFRPLFAEFTVASVAATMAPGSGNDAFEHMFAEYMPQPVIVIEEPPEPAIDIEALLAGMISVEEAQQRIDEAYDNGFAESRRQFEEDLTVVSRAFGAAVAEMRELRELVLKGSEDELLGLAIKLAERIIRQEITLDRTILARTVAEVVEKITERDGVVIRFNPEDYRIMTESGALVQAGVADMARMDVKADEDVTLGGCLVETSTGQIDGQIESQLTELFNQLKEKRVSHSGEPEDEQEEAFLP